jgi:hypothetical protein
MRRTERNSEASLARLFNYRDHTKAKRGGGTQSQNRGVGLIHRGNLPRASQTERARDTCVDLRTHGQRVAVVALRR